MFLCLLPFFFIQKGKEQKRFALLRVRREDQKRHEQSKGRGDRWRWQQEDLECQGGVLTLVFRNELIGAHIRYADSRNAVQVERHFIAKYGVAGSDDG